jgi:hypothetical protein
LHFIHEGVERTKRKHNRFLWCASYSVRGNDEIQARIHLA